MVKLRRFTIEYPHGCTVGSGCEDARLSALALAKFELMIDKMRAARCAD
jgi:hypothetical protein